MNSATYKILIFLISLTILSIWILGWFVSSFNVNNLPVSDTFNSLNTLFAGLAFAGVVVSIIMQFNELQKNEAELQETQKRNQEIVDTNMIVANEAKEKAILDLYQTYCSENFQIIKTSSFNIMISAIQNKNYADFMISRFFVISNKTLTQDIAEKLPIYKVSLEKGFDEFKQKEQFDRFRLDELINFFVLLSNKKYSHDVIKNCDFFYDWWRPLFWFISELQLEYYHNEENKQVRKYSKEPYFRNVVHSLDKIYKHTAFESKKEIWEYILNHPKIISYGIDQNYKVYIVHP